jgi:hypothetical protein
MLAKKLVVSIGVLGVLGQGLPAIAEDAVKATPSQIVVFGDRCPEWVCGFLRPRSRVEALSNDRAAKVNGVPAGKDVDQAVRSPGILYSIKADERKLVLQSPKPEEKKGEKSKVGGAGQSIRITTLDLDRKDNQAVFAADQILVGGERELVPGQALSIPLTFRIGETSVSGEYSGNLLVQHDKGDLLVPITVKVRDSWWMALGVLAFGVVLAAVLSAYQAEGFDRDEVRMMMSKLRRGMKQDVGLDDPKGAVAKLFQQRVEACLEDVEGHLDDKKWEDARKSMKEGQAVWRRWRKDDEAWIAQWNDCSGLKARIGKGGEQIPVDSEYGRQLSLGLDGVLRGMAGCETFDKFGELREPVRRKMQKYFDAKAKYDLVNALRTSISGGDWQTRVADLNRRLEQLSPEDNSGYETWMSDVKGLEQEMKEARKVSPSSPLDGRDAGPSAPVQLPPPPQASSAAPEAEGRIQRRLWWYGAGVRGMAIVLFCGLGFNQVYAGNATFGANPGADYSSLLAWGFSAEMTREAVAKVAQRFKVPVGGEK